MLIGITGKAGSGKDTLAQYFIDTLNFHRYSLADPIKRMIDAGFGTLPEVWEDRETKEQPIDWLGKSPRYLAQTLGTDWGRDLVHPDLWLLLAEQELGYNQHMIIPDVRFDNEAEWINKQGGIVIKVSGGIAPPADNAGHASENGVNFSFVTYTVQNTGTIEDLHRAGAGIWSVCGVLGNCYS